MILRRAIRYGHKNGKQYPIEELKRLLDEIEADSSPSNLDKIHKKWIGY